MKETITLSSREIQRIQVLEQVCRGIRTLVGSIPLLLVSYRQAKRLLARYREEGAAGLAHQRRGERAHNAYGPEMRDRVLGLHQDRYSKFNDTQIHATDDATGNALGMLFRPQEDAVGYLKLLDMVLRRHGIPAAVYQDRHSALHRNDNHWSHEEELAGIRFPTHVGRALQDLTIEVITAFSPQAKGRIERQGGTFQDRLIAEMELDGITEIDQANAWLESTFLNRFNTRFAKSPDEPGSVFRKISAAARYLKVSFAYEATVANDNTVRLGGLIIDIPPGPKRRSYARRRVLVRQHLDGAWTVWLDETRIARHPATPLREPLRTWKPRQHNENRRTRHILQVYLETTPAPSPWGHFCPADKGTS